jgi:MFS family permease
MNISKRAVHLSFALLVITTSVNVQGPLYATYALRDGYGMLATTIAFSFYVLGVLPVLLCLGGLSDRIGRRPVIFTSLVLSSSSTALMLLFPQIPTLAVARFLLGVGTALMSATATAYMIELLQSSDTSRAAGWVTASTSVGFGLGPALTSVFLMSNETLSPPSFYMILVGATISGVLVWRLPETVITKPMAPVSMLRLPFFTRDVFWFGGAIFLCWGTTGLVLSILPSVLAQHSLSKYAGLSSMLAISCGLLFQPIAKRLDPTRATQLGILILLPTYALMAWGASKGILWAVLAASLFASSSCYGFVYLGGLAGVAKAVGDEKARASAAFFLLAYLGFSLPVILTGMIADRYGTTTAFMAFGVLLLLGTLALLFGVVGERVGIGKRNEAPMEQ